MIPLNTKVKNEKVSLKFWVEHINSISSLQKKSSKQMEQGKSCLFFSYYNLCFCVPVPPSLWQEYCSSMVTFHQGIVNKKQENKDTNFITEE